jgi:hypothetical protein
MNIQTFFLVCGAISFAATEMAKPLTRILFKKRDARVFAVRLFACAIGAVAGVSFSPTVLGFWTGFTAGAFNAGIVGYLKFKITGRDTPTQQNDKDDDH